MYSKQVTSEQLSLASRALGMKLKRHSIAEVSFYQEHFRRLTEFNDKGIAQGWLKSERPNGLLPDELRYITNERTVCKLDFFYCATRYAFINDYEKNIVRFNPNKAQRIKLDIWATCEENKQAIEELDLKARRLGVSTLIELVLAWLAAFYSGSSALVASSDPQKSRDMADIIRLVYDMMPWWLMPTYTASQTGQLYEFFDMKSKITIRWGNQTSGIGRGGSPNLVHLSELPDFDDPQEKVGASLLRSIIPSPRVFVALESTAKGKGNWWYDQWQDAKEHWPNTRLQPIFLPWYVGDDIYPTPTWLQSHPIPRDWKPMNATSGHADTARKYVTVNPLLQKYLGADWKMSRKQMWYWEFNREEARRTKSLHKFLEEMPGDDIEAFQSPHGSIFDAELVSDIRTAIPDPQVFEIRGPEDEIPHFQHYHPTEYEGTPITVTPRWLDSLEPSIYTLQPLAFHGYPSLSAVGKLFVWEWPEEDEEYGLGVDTSYGKGGDASAIEVIRNRTMRRPDAQVAEFVSPHLDSHLLWPYVMAIAELYSVNRNGSKQQPRLAIEFAANGQEVQREVHDRGYWNFHQKIPDDAKIVDFSHQHRIGFEMTKKSRPKVTQGLEHAIRDRVITVNSPWLLEECGGLIWNADKQRLEAGYGSHDDRFMALGMIRESFRQTETPSMRVYAHAQKVERDAQANYHPIFRKPDQSRDVPSEWLTDNEDQFRGILD